MGHVAGSGMDHVAGSRIDHGAGSGIGQGKGSGNVHVVGSDIDHEGGKGNVLVETSEDDITAQFRFDRYRLSRELEQWAERARTNTLSSCWFLNPPRRPTWDVWAGYSS